MFAKHQPLQICGNGCTEQEASSGIILDDQILDITDSAIPPINAQLLTSGFGQQQAWTPQPSINFGIGLTFGF